MLAADARLTLLVCSLFPFIVLNAHLYNRRAAPLFLKARKAASDITGFLAERLEGLSIIRAFAAEEYCRTEMEDLNRKKYDLELRALRLDIFFFNALGLAETLSICALLWFGGRWVAEGALTAGALVGSTAAGKTTITSLLLRFYEPDGGAVFLDGTDIRLIPEEKLRSRIAPVLQDINVFPGSVAENLNPGGMLESATLKEKLARLPLDEVLPDTAKEESGRDLSVGQKQLISFARALLRNPDVLVLDEATSYIDPSSEEKARSAMHLLMEGRTCLIIAHRLSTVKDADCILVIQEGRITEQGTHRELLEKGGHYSALHSL
jgi:ABC-type multidrug transport system fused ATPase/permease subunit